MPPLMAGETVMAFSLDEELPTATTRFVEDFQKEDAAPAAPADAMASQFGLVIDENATPRTHARKEEIFPDLAESSETVMGFVGAEGVVAEPEGVIELPALEVEELDTAPQSDPEIVEATSETQAEPTKAATAPLITAGRSIAMLVPAGMLVEGLLGKE